MRAAAIVCASPASRGVVRNGAPAARNQMAARDTISKCLNFNGKISAARGRHFPERRGAGSSSPSRPRFAA